MHQKLFLSLLLMWPICHGTVTLNKTGFPVVEYIQYRLGTEGEWTRYYIGNAISVLPGESVQFQNLNERLSTSYDDYVKFSFSKKFSASGSMRSMVNYSNELSDYSFTELFNYAIQLTSPPLMDFDKIGVGACAYMFQKCTSLTQVPELPATEIRDECYMGMFYGCTSLVNPQTILPADTLYSKCYYHMFYECQRLTQAPELPAKNLASYCYDNMFYNCAKLIQAPELPATTLADNCYGMMFCGCTSLTQAPELPATTLARSCYNRMFEKCSHLANIKVSFTSWNSASIPTNNWLDGVAAFGDFECPEKLKLEYGVGRIPVGWAVNGVGNIIVENQYITQSVSDPVNFTPKYTIYPEGGELQFSIYSGSLPGGLTLNSDGSITGQVSEPWEGKIVIQITGENYFSKTFTLTISLIGEGVKVTSNNLTSNTSNPDFVVSQRSSVSPNEAWKAMDGDITSFSKTQYESGQYDWWQIDFLKPVSVTKVYFKCQNESSSTKTYLEYSDDGATFYRYDETEIPATTEQTRTYEKGAPHRYYRFTSIQATYYIQFFEITFTYEPVEKYINLPETSRKQAIVGNYFEYQIPYEKYPDDLEVTFEITQGTLPEGVIFDNTTGILQGTFNEAGEVNLTISMSAEGLESESMSLTLIVTEKGTIPTDAILYLDGHSPLLAETGQVFIKNGTGEVVSTDYGDYKVLSFQNGSPCLVSNEADSNVPLNNADRCISLWAKPTNNTGQGLLSYGQNTANKAWQFALQSDCRLKIGGSNAASNEYVSPTDASAGLAWNDWHHYLINKVNGVEYLYIDNRLVGSFNYTRSTSYGIYVIGAGQDYHLTTGYRFSGYITGIRMFNRSLNEAEILALSQEYTF